MLIGNVPVMGKVRLKEESTIQLRTIDGKVITRLLNDPSQEPFEQGRNGEWRLHSGVIVQTSPHIINILPIYINGRS